MKSIKLNQKIGILAILILLVLPGIASADDFMKKGQGRAWYESQSSEFHDYVSGVWSALIWVVAFAFVVITALQIAGIRANDSMGRQAQRVQSEHVIGRNFAVLVIAVVAILVAPNFIPWY